MWVLIFPKDLSRNKAAGKAVLVLEDGSIYYGKAFGSNSKASGEIVFNTGMVGYTEAVTDPSYYGQILCQTYPLIGNYGVSKKDFESNAPKIAGYIVGELCERPSHYSSEMNLSEWLKKERIPGIQGIDTRQLTKVLREKGTMLGLIQTGGKFSEEELLQEATRIEDPNERDLVAGATIKKEIFYEGRKERIAVIDCGCKENIIRNLQKRNAEVARLPAGFSAEKILSFNPDGVLISNGPGDPKKINYVVENVKKLIECRVPLFGICLGNQVLARALGVDTFKLKFGHRGQNHPVIELKSGRCHITSQNHGFAVKAESIEGKAEVTYLNANDGTIEGIENKKKNLFGVQFHPEAGPGPYDTEFLFDKFLKMVVENSKK